MGMYGDFVKTISVDNDNDWVCETCGSDQLEEKVWVSVNTKEYISDCDDEGAYCQNCEDYVDMVTRKEWKANHEIIIDDMEK